MVVLKIQFKALYIYLGFFLGNQAWEKLEGTVGAPFSPASGYRGEGDMEIHSLSKAIPESIWYKDSIPSPFLCLLLSALTQGSLHFRRDHWLSEYQLAVQWFKGKQEGTGGYKDSSSQKDSGSCSHTAEQPVLEQGCTSFRHKRWKVSWLQPHTVAGSHRKMLCFSSPSFRAINFS